MNNREDRYSTKEFKNVLSRYTSAQDNNNNVFFDLDDLVDIAEYYNCNGDYEASKQAARYALQLYHGATGPLALLSRMAMFNDNDIEAAKAYANDIEDKYDLEYYYLTAEIMIMEDDVNGADKYLESKIVLLEDEDLDDFYFEVPAIFIDYNLPEIAQKWLARCEDKTDVEYQFMQGRIEYLNGDYKLSERIFKTLIEQEPFSTQIWDSLAMSQYMRNRFIPSIESSDYAMAINPSDTDAMLNKANCLSALGNNKEAADFYKRYLKFFGSDANTRLLLAVTLMADGKYDEALNELETAERLCDNASSLTVISKETAYALSCLDRGEEAILYLDNAERQGNMNHNDRLMAEGYIYLSQGQPDYARDCFVNAIINSKFSDKVRMEMIVSYFDFEYYGQVYDMLYPTLSDENNTETKGYAYLAYSCKMLGMHDKFLSFMKKACELNPTEAQAVLGKLFPKDCPTENYFSYAVKHNV